MSDVGNMNSDLDVPVLEVFEGDGVIHILAASRIDRHDEGVPKIPTGGHLARLRAPVYCTLRTWKFFQNSVREWRDLYAVLNEDRIDLSLEISDLTEAFDEVTLGILRVDRPVVYPHQDTGSLM